MIPALIQLTFQMETDNNAINVTDTMLEDKYYEQNVENANR